MSDYPLFPPARRWTDIRITALESVAVVLIAGASILLASRFAATQSIWLDETTQLSGLRLSWGEQLRWLAGEAALAPGVPPDRMPPLSYWVGKLWGSVFGFSEDSLRALGMTAVALATPALYLAGRAIGGLAGGLFVAAFVMLGPNIVSLAGDIRAYPIFFAVQAWAACVFTLLVLDERPALRRRRLALLGGLLVAGIYCHFFGIVAAGCLLASLTATRLAEGQRSVDVLIAGVAVGVASLGVIPFVLAATAMSDGAGTAVTLGEGLRDVARLVYRLLAHPALSAMPWVQVAFLTAFGALLLLTILRLLLARRPDPAGAALGIALPAAIALASLAVLRLVVTGFDVLHPGYNIWIVAYPPLLCAFAFRRDLGASRLTHLCIGLAGAAAAGGLSGSITLARYGTIYSHGPAEWVLDRVGDPSSTLVLHDGTGPWGFVYFPLYWMTDGRATQWLLRPDDNSIVTITPEGFAPVPDAAEARSRFGTVLFASARSLGAAELSDIVRGNVACADLIEPALPPEAELVHEESFCAFVGATLTEIPADRPWVFGSAGR